MRKREREITLLYGMSLIREDVLKHPVPVISGKDRFICLVHILVSIAALGSVLLAALILIVSFIPYQG